MAPSPRVCRPLLLSLAAGAFLVACGGSDNETVSRKAPSGAKGGSGGGGGRAGSGIAQGGGAPGPGGAAGAGKGGAPGPGGAAGTGGSHVVGPPLEADGFRATLAAAICSGAAPCCALAGVPAVRSDCVSQALSLLNGTKTTQATPERPTFSPVHAARCLAEVKASLAICGYPPGVDLLLRDACDNVFRGKVALGGACAQTSDCASRDDAFDVECPFGECRALLQAAAGETCQGQRYFGGSTTSYAGIDATTVLMCPSHDRLDCVAAGKPPVRTCVPLPAVGAPCTLECGEGRCDENVCVPTGPGTPCTKKCASDLTSACVAGVCVARAAAGQPCGDGCLPGLSCDNFGGSRCVLALPWIHLTKSFCGGQ